MATSSDGGDNYTPSTLSNTLNNGTTSGDLRYFLQSLLDDKEKQLQQAGTLGQQLLAQRMELDDTVRMLLETLDAGDGDEVREKLRDLEDTLKSWDNENEQLSLPLGVKQPVNGTPSSPPADVSRGSIPRSADRSKASVTGTTAAQSSRRAKNAAHRANDVEFALDIGNGLLTEVRRLQALLTEREQALQDMKEFKDDLEKTIEGLRTALREQEQSSDKFREENWNQEVVIQDLRTQQTELQATAQRLESEQKRLTKVLATTRESADHFKNELERVQTASEEQKQKHDTAGAQYRRQIASLQRQIFDLQQTNENTKAELVKAQRKSPRFLSPTTPNGAASSTAATPATGDLTDDFFMSGGASTRSRKMDTSGLFPLEDFEYADESPDASPSRPFLAPNHPSNENEVLQQRLAHAQRQIQTLKGSLQREKELRIDYRRKLDASMKSDEEVEVEEGEDEVAEEAVIEESKPKARLTPYRAGRGRGRGRGRGGMTLLQRLAAHSPSSEYDIDEKDEDETAAPPVPPLQSTSRLDDEEQEELNVEQSPTPPVKSNRTSVDGMDPAFANVLKRSGSARAFPHSPSPFRHSIFARSKVVARRPRGGAAYQQARPPSFAAEPEALANELGQADFSSSEATSLPEAAKETVDAGCQTQVDEPVVPAVIVTQPSAPTLPVVSEIGIQVDPEPIPVPRVSEVSSQTDEIPVSLPPPRVDSGIQHEDLSPRPILVSCSVETEPEVVPEAPKAVMPVLPPPPVLVSTETQTVAILEPPKAPLPVLPPPPVLVSAETQTTAVAEVPKEVVPVLPPPPVLVSAETQTIVVPEAAMAVMPTPPVLVCVETQTIAIPEAPKDVPVLPPPPVLVSAEAQTIAIPLADAVAQTNPEPIPARFNADVQTLLPPLPISTNTSTQTVEVVVPTAEMEVQATELPQPKAVLRELSIATVDVSVGDGSSIGDDSGDNTVTIRKTPSGQLVIDDDDDTHTETASMMGTDMDEYVDARQSMSLVTPTESLEDYHSIMTVTDNDFSESSDDGESIKASQVSRPTSMAGLQQEPTIIAEPPAVVYESKAVSADFLPEVPPPPQEVLPPPPPPPLPKPEVREISIQTDEWSPPIPPVPASPSPSVFRVGPPSQQFQFISPPPSAGPTTTSLPISPASPLATLRDVGASFIPRPRTAASDRRQSIESTLSAAIVDEALTRSRTPSNVASVVDKSRPPMMVLPPPPRAPPPPNSMLPPPFIPEKRQTTVSTSSSHEAAPPRPSSPPPPELIQRATTPTFGSVLSIPSARPFGLRHHGSNLPPSSAASMRQPPSTSSFRSAINTVSRIPQASPSVLSHSIQERERREMSLTSLTSGEHTSGARSESQHSSVSSERYEHENEQEQEASQEASVAVDRTARASTGTATDPAVIHAITQTMIGEFLYKYTRKTIGKGHGERRHKRFFWVHPYTRTLYWSNADPGSANVSESSAKSAYVEAVRSVMDPNPMPPGIYQYSVVVTTPHREMKFTAPTKERHDIWVHALQYLLTRPSPNATSPANGMVAPLSPQSNEAELSEAEHPHRPAAFASPQSQRSVRTNMTAISADSWTSTPRGQRSNSQLSHRGGSIGKRSGTPAVEYLRWGGPDGPQSPSREYEQISGQQDEDDLEFELHGDSMSDEGFEGLENVRACCDGRHTVGRSGKIEHHHHHHQHQHAASAQEPAHINLLDPTQHEIPARPVSPAWSFRSRAGSTHSTDGQGFFSRFGTRRSAKTIPADHR